MGQNCIWYIQISRNDVLDLHFQVMACEMACYIVVQSLVLDVS